jgi:putative ABC transport system substrate-binding protein
MAMRRREFIAALGGVAAWPLVARAQQQAVPVIGFLSGSSSILATKRIASFSQGLSEAGYVASRDVAIEQRLAEGQYERLPALAAELVSRRVRLIAALASAAAFAAKKATTTIPIVFVGALDPATPPAARQRPQPDAKNFGEEVSLASSSLIAFVARA